MVKVITYGTYDLLHFGHIRLLERAKALGDYLIVGITADDFDKSRGKINVKQSLMERIEGVRATGIADEIIIEEYEGQKIDDIKRYDVDIFTVGSDWVGQFDYLQEYCKVVYLERTEGISSTTLRAENCAIRFGLIGQSGLVRKYWDESKFVNGLECVATCTSDKGFTENNEWCTSSFSELLTQCDAVYIATHPSLQYAQIKEALEKGKHVLCESPLALKLSEYQELFQLARQKGLILMEAIKTAYSTAYSRLLLLLKSGKIGEVVSVDAVCTSLRYDADRGYDAQWNSICEWGPTALLPVFQILGTEYKEERIASAFVNDSYRFDMFSKVDFLYPNAVASIKVGKGVKAEGELIITGTKGYAYVPAPWWKTDYFEIRYENPANNLRYYYQLEGEGIRYELVSFMKAIEKGKSMSAIDEKTSSAIALIIEKFHEGNDIANITIS